MVRPIQEFDWHIGSAQRILKALEDILSQVDMRLESTAEQWQIDDAIELAENTLGLAFVSVQVYISGSLVMLNRLMRPSPQLKKEQSLREFGKPLPDNEVTDIQLCDGMANYYKHHDEWTVASARGRQAKVISLLRAAGVDPFEPYPCIQAGEILFPGGESGYLRGFTEIITGWREKQLSSIRETLDPKTSKHRGA